MGSYVYFKKINSAQESISYSEIIPQKFTSEIIEINTPSKKLEELFNSNLIWKEMSENSRFKKIENFWNMKDSVFTEIKIEAKILYFFKRDETNEDYFVLKFNKKPSLIQLKNWKTKVIGNHLFLTQGKDLSFFLDTKINKSSLSVNAKFASVFSSNGSKDNKINVFTKKGDNWSAFDITFLPEQIFTNGFEENKFKLYSLKSLIDLSVLSKIPYQFKSLKLIHFDSTSQIRKDKKYLKSVSERCNCDIDYTAYSWIESPSVFFKSQFQDASYTVLKLASISDFKDNINSLLPDSSVLDIDDNRVIKSFENSYDYNSIFKTNMKYNYFVRIDDYVMFSEEKIHLERLLFQQFSNFTIDKKTDLHSYLVNNINKKSSEVSISGGINYWDFDLKSGIGLAQSHTESKDLIYKSVLYTKELNLDGGKTNPKWNLVFNAPLREPIYVVKNHRTKDNDYIVQDKKNTIYFVTPNGEIKWKKEIKNPIIGKIKNIDIFGNNKYQLIFNTKNQLYILDVLGRNVQNFPVKILDSATANLSVMDYDKDLNFRFLVPTKQGIKSVNKQGKIVTGWLQPKQESSVVTDINHLLINGLDYIQLQDAKGKLYFYNRKGEVRHTVSSNFNNELHTLHGSSIEQTRAIYFDSVSNSIKRQFFSDKPVSVLFSPEEKIKEFHFVDFDNDKNRDFILLFEDEIKIYGQDLILLQKIDLPKNISQFEIWKGGFGYLNQFNDFTFTQGGNIKVIEGANGYQIDFYKNKVRAIIKGENSLKLLHI